MLLGDNVIIHQGYLWKQTTCIWRNWREKYFVLGRHSLLCYQHETDFINQFEPKFEIPLNYITNTEVSKKKKHKYLTLVLEDNSRICLKSTVKDTTEWLEKLLNAIRLCKSRMDLQKEIKRASFKRHVEGNVRDKYANNFVSVDEIPTITLLRRISSDRNKTSSVPDLTRSPFNCGRRSSGVYRENLSPFSQRYHIQYRSFNEAHHLQSRHRQSNQYRSADNLSVNSDLGIISNASGSVYGDNCPRSPRPPRKSPQTSRSSSQTNLASELSAFIQERKQRQSGGNGRLANNERSPIGSPMPSNPASPSRSPKVGRVQSQEALASDLARYLEQTTLSPRLNNRQYVINGNSELKSSGSFSVLNQKTLYPKSLSAQSLRGDLQDKLSYEHEIGGINEESGDMSEDTDGFQSNDECGLLTATRNSRYSSFGDFVRNRHFINFRGALGIPGGCHNPYRRANSMDDLLSPDHAFSEDDFDGYQTDSPSFVRQKGIHSKTPSPQRSPGKTMQRRRSQLEHEFRKNLVNALKAKMPPGRPPPPRPPPPYKSSSCGSINGVGISPTVSPRLGSRLDVQTSRSNLSSPSMSPRQSAQNSPVQRGRYSGPRPRSPRQGNGGGGDWSPSMNTVQEDPEQSPLPSRRNTLATPSPDSRKRGRKKDKLDWL